MKIFYVTIKIVTSLIIGICRSDLLAIRVLDIDSNWPEFPRQILDSGFDPFRFSIYCFCHLQILIDDLSWCLLSSQKCVSHFIGIWNCYLTNCAFGFSMELMFFMRRHQTLLIKQASNIAISGTKSLGKHTLLF